MESEKFRTMINQMIDDKLNSMTNMAVPNHYHNGWDSNQLDPAVSLLGFPVVQPDNNDVTVAPTDTPANGTFRFYVDFNNGGSGVARYRFWAYIVYANSGVLTGAWKSVALT